MAYRNQGRIYYSEYILFLFFWQRIRIFICDIPHPAWRGRQRRRRGSVMSEPYYVIIIGPYYYNSHITPAPPPATADTDQY